MIGPLDYRAVHATVDADFSEGRHDGGRVGIQNDGHRVADLGGEAVSPRSVWATRLQERDDPVFPGAPLDDVQAFGRCLRHFTIIPERYDNSAVGEFAVTAHPRQF